MSCDNIQGNGDVARSMFTTDADRAAISTEFGVEDAWPVVCEPFEQWALEDTFSLGRPPLEDAGVQLVADVEPYELMKLRLLNASHQGMCYFGYLAGYRYAHEVAQDPLFAQFLLDYMDKEGGHPHPGAGARRGPRPLQTHPHRAVLQRTRPGHPGPPVRGKLGPDPKWLLPVIRINLERGGDIHRSAAIVASWARYAEGADEQGNPIDVVDRVRVRVRVRVKLMVSAARQRQEPLAFISDRQVFGDLTGNRSSSPRIPRR